MTYVTPYDKDREENYVCLPSIPPLLHKYLTCIPTPLIMLTFFIVKLVPFQHLQAWVGFTSSFDAHKSCYKPHV